MSVPRTISHGRCAFVRGFANRRATASFLNITSTANPQRQFSAAPRVQEEVIQKPATGSNVSPASSTSGNNANSIAILRLPWNTAPADVERILRDAGVTIKKLQIRIDRFTFQTDASAFIKLGSKAEMQKALTALNGQILDGRALRVTQVNENFFWDSGFKKDQRFFIYDAATPYQAIQGLLEGRRYRLYVENPGWFIKVEGKSIGAARREIINKVFKPFNMETFGGLSPVWRQDKRASSTFLASIDFATKEDAQCAVDALDGTVIEGRRVELKPLTIGPKRAEQIGKVDQGVLAKVREAGLLTKEE